MKYFTAYDEEGCVIAHYCDSIHTSIPKDAVEMTEEEWQLSCQGLIIRDIKNKKWIKKPEPTKLEILNNKKLSRKYQINNERKNKIESGVEFENNLYDSTEQSMKNLNEVLMSISFGIDLPTDYTWRTKDNKNTPMDKEKLTSLYKTMIEHKNNCYKKSWELKEKIEKAKTIEEVTKIQW